MCSFYAAVAAEVPTALEVEEERGAYERFSDALDAAWKRPALPMVPRDLSELRTGGNVEAWYFSAMGLRS